MAMEERNFNDMENCDTEHMMFRRKLQLKSEALQVVSEELDKCRAQRDQFKLMAEQIQERFLQLKQQLNERKSLDRTYDSCDYQTLDSLMETREQNKCLKLQVETLRQKLNDATADIKVIRSRNHACTESLGLRNAPAVHQREEMIEQLEKLNIKCAQLQTDLQSMLDEKHELETERDAFKCKAHRLNHELSKALSASEPVDVDALVNENRYLQERLQQLLEEKELARQSLTKYKSMLDGRKLKGSIKLGGNAAAGTVMTHKQVEQLLQQGPNIPPQKSAAAVSDLHGLCVALLEALSDKTLALVHQKKANKILASRICELDDAVQSPTAKLLEGYTSADVDSKSDLDVAEFEHSLNQSWDREESKIGDEKREDEKVGNRQIPHPFNSFQLNLPQNLSALVEKALLNLKRSEKKTT